MKNGEEAAGKTMKERKDKDGMNRLMCASMQGFKMEKEKYPAGGVPAGRRPRRGMGALPCNRLPSEMTPRTS